MAKLLSEFDKVVLIFNKLFMSDTFALSHSVILLPYGKCSAVLGEKIIDEKLISGLTVNIIADCCIGVIK